MLGIDDYELAAIFTVQTAGEALNHHPHLHGLLADGYWKGDVFTRFPEAEEQESDYRQDFGEFRSRANVKHRCVSSPSFKTNTQSRTS